MRKVFLVVILLTAAKSYCNAQLAPASDQLNLSDYAGWDYEEEEGRGFTFAIDLGVYLASKKTAFLYNGSGSAQVNNQSIWYSIPQRFEVGQGNPGNVIQEINNQYPEYSGTVTGFSIGQDDLPLDMNYSPRLFFSLGATYHASKYWAITAKSTLANLKSTAVYTMELIGPTIPQNASSVIQQFDLTGEEQRLHLDLGFKNTSYNDYGFKWFWGGGISLVGARFKSNTAFIGTRGYELLVSDTGNTQIISPFTANQTAYGIGFFGTTGWEMEYNDRYDFGIGFVLSRDPIELGGITTNTFNKRIYISFGI